MKPAPSRRSGLTFIELLVTIGLVSIVSGFLIAGFGGSNENQKFQNDAEVFFANVRLAQNNALSGVRADICTNIPTGNFAGWTLRINPGGNSYKVGLVCSLNGVYSIGLGGNSTTYTFSANTRIQGITDPCSSGPPCTSQADCVSTNNYFFLYTAPYGNIKFYKAEGGSTIVPQNGFTDITTVSQIGIKLTNSKVQNLAKGIGISPAGGTVLKNLSSSEWDCGASWTAF